ncbi:hypothetical protein ACE38W_04990 [Chitinophaga sp. Hz27]|uniref:hypothetical protein n=1 Tax=Chitinophaga sp. Hz27 TaxID=3347169 RepID=UPI0035DA9AE9
MNNYQDPEQEKPDTPAEDDPSWGGVIAGLMLATAGIALIYNRYQQFHDPGNDPVSLTRIEIFIYKVGGGSEWILLGLYALIALVGLYLTISNIIRLRMK